MANIYVDSVTGNDSNDGLTPATAKATLRGAALIDAVGDTIFVSNVHNESSTAPQAVDVAGTALVPTKIICADFSTTPPTVASTGAKVSTTGANNIGVNGYGYISGIEFSAGSGSSVANFSNNGVTTAGTQVYEYCKMTLANTSASSLLNIGSGGGQTYFSAKWKNVDVSMGSPNQTMYVNGPFTWEGGTFTGSSSMTMVGIVGFGFRGGSAIISGVDFSAMTQSSNLVRVGNACGRILFSNCKLPTGWNGNLTNIAIIAQGTRVVLANCDSGDTNYKMQVADYAGDISVDTTITRSGGATDGNTPVSWRMVSNTNAVFPSAVLESEEILRWFPVTDIGESLGSSVGFAVEIISDSSANLKDDEVWIEAQVFSTNGFPLGTYVSDRKANILGAGVDQTASSELWTSSSMTAPKRQTLRVDTTPREAGYVSLKVCLAKPSTTIYVCPKVRVV